MTTETFKNWFVGKLKTNNAKVKYEDRKGIHREIEVSWPKNGTYDVDAKSIKLLDVELKKTFDFHWDQLVSYRFNE